VCNQGRSICAVAKGQGKGVQRETGTAHCPGVPLAADACASELAEWTPKRTPKELNRVMSGYVDLA